MTAPPADAQSASSAAPQPRRRIISVWLYWLGTIFVWALIATLFFFFFGSIRMVLLDFIGAAAIASARAPLTHWRRGPQWFRGAVVGILFIVLLAAILSGLGWLLQAPIHNEFAQWPQLRDNINSLLTGWSERLGLAEPLTLQSLFSRIAVFITGANAGHLIGRTADIAINVGITLALVFIGMIYLLIEPDGHLVNPILRMLPEQRRSDLRGTLDAIEFRLRWWLIGVVISMTIIGSLSWVGYYFVGLRFALPLAIFAGIAEIVPNIGALTAFAVAVVVAATQSSGVVIGVIVVHSITLFLEAHVIQPLVMRGAVKVPPIITIFTVVLWAEVFGFGGLLLALPIDLILWIAAENFILHDRSAIPPKRRSKPPP